MTTTKLDAQKIQEAVNIARLYGGFDGGHHKDWVIDQMCRALLQDRYETFVAKARAGKDGPNTFEWNEGVAP